MSSISATALSGVQAAQTRLNASANNVANAQTEGYRRERVDQTPQDAGGVQASVSKAPEPGVDLAAELVEQKMAVYAFKANLQVIQTDAAMAGRLLDEQA